VQDAAADDDARTVQQVLAGDREAFGVLVARHARRVHDLARRMLKDAQEAEDVVQQAFVNAWRALDRFDPRRPFRHWLLRITTNLALHRIERRRREPRGRGAPIDPGEGPLDPPARPDGGPDPDDRRDARRVRAALEDLPTRYRLTAVLRYAHGLRLEEIAEITGEPLGTVKTHLHRARAALREAVEGTPGDETGSARAGTEG
jgi:RNA polymerase sigma-70 factor (ECF subfamily)